MKTLAESTLAVCLLLASLVPSRTADAQCNIGWGKWRDMPIRVLINENMDDLLCPSSSCRNFNDIHYTIEAVLAEFYYATGGALRFIYSGTTDEPPSTIIPGYLHIFSNSCGGTLLGIAAADGDAVKPWGKVRICSSNASGNIRWNSYHHETNSSGTWFSFHQVLLHEIGHVIGLDHIEACMETPWASVMHAFYRSDRSHHLAYPDTAFVESEYGLRTNKGFAHWSDDALSWPTGAGAPDVSRSLGRFAASNSRSGSDIFVARSDPWSHQVHLSRYNGFSWFHVTTRPYWTHAHPGVASRSNQELLLSHVGAYDLFTGKQKVYVQESHDSGGTWDKARIVTTSASDTANPGTSSTYDPSSGSYITVWRGAPTDRNAIFYYVEGGNPYKLEDPITGGDVLASDTPSIACAPVSVVGTYNCLMTWPDARSWARVARWTQGRVQNGRLILLSIRTHGYVTSGSPSVAYSSTGSLPWHIALSQGGSTTYMWRKGASPSAGFQDQRNFAHTPPSALPAAGSRIAGSGRRYVFTLSE